MLSLLSFLFVLYAMGALEGRYALVLVALLAALLALTFAHAPLVFEQGRTQAMALVVTNPDLSWALYDVLGTDVGALTRWCVYASPRGPLRSV